MKIDLPTSGAFTPADDGHLHVNVRKLIRFFDEDEEAQQDASSIKGVIGEELAMACLKHYFETRQSGTHAQVLMNLTTRRRLACTTGGARRHELDGWLRVDGGGTTVTYQVEVKSWSFHGIGSRKRRILVVNPNSAAELKLKKKIFQSYYCSETLTLPQAGVSKVLLKMNVPHDVRQLCGYDIENPQPLLCLWEAVCPNDAESSAAFFTVPVAPLTNIAKPNCQAGGFGELAIFSVSNYLRDFLAKAAGHDGDPRLRLHLPRITARIRGIAEIFSGAS